MSSYCDDASRSSLKRGWSNTLADSGSTYQCCDLLLGLIDGFDSLVECLATFVNLLAFLCIGFLDALQSPLLLLQFSLSLLNLVLECCFGDFERILDIGDLALDHCTY